MYYGMNVAAAVRSVIWNANRNSSGRNKPTVLHIPGLNTEPFPNVNIHQKITVDEIKQLKTKFNEIDTKLGPLGVVMPHNIAFQGWKDKI